MNKVVLTLLIVVILIVGAVVGVLVATGTLRVGNEVEEVFCKDSAGELILCEDLP